MMRPILVTKTPTLTLERQVLRTELSPSPPVIVGRRSRRHLRCVAYQNQYYQKSHIMDSPENYSHRAARQLRFITLLSFVPGIILLVASFLINGGELTLVKIGLLSLSTFLGLVAVVVDRPMPWMVYVDLCMAIFHISVLIPTYVRSVVTPRVLPSLLLLYALTICTM